MITQVRTIDGEEATQQRLGVLSMPRFGASLLVQLSREQEL